MTVATPNQDYLAFEAAMKARDPRWYESSPACIGYMAWCASRDSAAQQEPLCMCKDRALGACPGEWEPGCDLGNNPAHVRPAGITATKGGAMSANLPPLPEPLVMVNRYGLGNATSDGDGGVFTADQMRAYATKAVAAQAAELEAMRADAERYRYLRQQHWYEAALCVVVNPKNAVKLGHDCPSRERLDSAVDAARAALKEQTPNVGGEA